MRKIFISRRPERAEQQMSQSEKLKADARLPLSK